MEGEGRAQSELIGTILITGVVVIVMTTAGVGIVSYQQQQIETTQQPSSFRATHNETALTLTHTGGADYPLTDLVAVLSRGTTDRRYELGDPADRITSTLDGDDQFEAGESITISHSFVGDVDVFLFDTSTNGYLLFEETITVENDGVVVSPAIERFEITDTSSGGNASYEVTWNASDPQGDLVEVTVALVDGGTVVDSVTSSFGGVATSGVQTDSLRNDSGGGEVYAIRIVATDAGGNTATSQVGDTADSRIGLRPPSIETFQADDVSTGGEVSYDYTYNASDPDGDIVRVRLRLVDTDTDTVVDTVTDNFSQVNATGVQTGTLSDPANGKNDGVEYRITMTVTDLEGNKVDAQSTDVADGDGSAGGAGVAPSVDSLVVEDTTQSGGNGKADATFDVSWNGSDADGNLANASLELVGPNQNVVDSVTYANATDFANGSATGRLTGSLSDKNGEGNQYTIRVVLRDENGKSDTRSVTQVADGSGGASGTGSPPSVGTFDITDTTPTGNNADAMFDVTWNATDADGNLANATLELVREQNGQVVDTVEFTTSDFANGSATGTLTGSLSHNNGRDDQYTIRLVVRDDAGNSDSRSNTQTADGNDGG